MLAKVPKSLKKRTTRLVNMPSVGQADYSLKINLGFRAITGQNLPYATIIPQRLSLKSAGFSSKEIVGEPALPL